MPGLAHQTLRRLARINVCLHILGLAVALVGIRPGTAIAALPERMAYVSGAPLAWTGGWGIWMLCAFAASGFVAALAHHLPDAGGAARAGAAFAIAGAALDTFTETIQVAVLPQVAGWGAAEARLYLALERLATLGGAVIANQFYSVGVLLATLCLHGRGADARPAVAAGYAVFVFGTLLSAAGLSGAPSLMELATGPTILCFCAWTLLATRAVAGPRDPGTGP